MKFLGDIHLEIISNTVIIALHKLQGNVLKLQNQNYFFSVMSITFTSDVLKRFGQHWNRKFFFKYCKA